MDERSRRFIAAYNKIDKTLRDRLNLKPSIPFADVIRRATGTLNTVKRYEDDLLAYARLRNAIVHGATKDQTIAEPHLKTVQIIEEIAKLITTPPLAIDFAKKAQVLKASEPLLNAIITMTNNDYSNMPVVNDERIIGVLTNKLLVKVFSKLLQNKNNDICSYMAANTVASALNNDDSHYCIMSERATIDEVLNCYVSNPKLQIVILKSLKDNAISGVITTGDVSRLNEELNGR